MAGSLTVAERRSEVSKWLRTSLPKGWVEKIDSGRSPGSTHGYDDFDEEAWLADLFDRRYLVAEWPVEYGGLAWDRESVLMAFEELSRYEVPLPLYVTSQLLAGAGLLQHGTPAQRDRFLPNIASAEEIWTQLFSEPEAGSDLAALRTKAVADGDHWVVSGQKVWSTCAHFAPWGLLLARTGAADSRNRGITCFILDMKGEGVDVRPLRQLTGDASFNEVFLDGAVIDDSLRLGPVNEGWSVARSILEAERGELGQRRVGGVDIHWLIDRHSGTTDSVVRQQLARAYTLEQLVRWMAWRGYGRGNGAQVAKLLRAESNMDLQRLAFDLEGMRAAAYADGDREAMDVEYGLLRSRANSIGGGTSEIMRNVIGERVLGLPREPRP